jgi:hypothetical protein
MGKMSSYSESGVCKIKKMVGEMNNRWQEDFVSIWMVER